ncbi:MULTISPECIES: acyl-CoA dehydrogenase family protein [unclassified Janthinobacterium]|uniref:acyl-CoA dehydrogenase family protein n=1 Tax=unclassified Janthinobacterium TaxID=2610881 RepID=UPI001621753A|nr:MULTISPECIES: acyl-CoA dehydrogenase family protein [unclassified Janthinobacterium]MBB5609232.1 alkylation response protein AidB-like acyl-CoA dehydrogenase [Janthinobacterium sp. S3T4]MBB5614405.1 alkylation response protein AidB-like acyl-CoA dehydrogenase [Janthinobacterium sp. S3M3]
MSSVLPLPSHHTGPAAPDAISIATALAARLAETANARDQAGGHAAQEREWLRESGLLTLSVPVQFGGQGAPWTLVCQVIRILARADSALAHVFGFHHLQLAGLQLYGNAQQQRRLLTLTVDERLFWGNALNPLDRRVTAQDSGDGYLLDGIKSFSSGSVGSDWLTVSAWHAPTQTALIAALPTRQAGVQVNPDWDAFGQRQTDSGNVHFEQVFLPSELVLQAPAQAATPQATVRSQIAQLIMTNLYLGIAEGAFEAARRYTEEQAKAWFASGVDKASDDPLVQHRYGQLWLLLRPAQVLAGVAAQELDTVYRKGALITAQDRGQLAVAVAEAKALAHKAGLEISSQMFELTGARSTSAHYGFDRYWRNVRVHTLHDPIDYKLRDLGRYALSGTLPEPTAYS